MALLPLGEHHWGLSWVCLPPWDVSVLGLFLWTTEMSQTEKLRNSTQQPMSWFSAVNSQLYTWSFRDPENLPLWEFVLLHVGRPRHWRIPPRLVGNNLRVVPTETTHYSDVTWASWRLRSQLTSLFAQQQFRADSEDKSKFPITGPM